jgi:hypothetical protein
LPVVLLPVDVAAGLPLFVRDAVAFAQSELAAGAAGESFLNPDARLLGLEARGLAAGQLAAADALTDARLLMALVLVDPDAAAVRVAPLRVRRRRKERGPGQRRDD